MDTKCGFVSSSITRFSFKSKTTFMFLYALRSNSCAIPLVPSRSLPCQPSEITFEEEGEGSCRGQSAANQVYSITVFYCYDCFGRKYSDLREVRVFVYVCMCV